MTEKKRVVIFGESLMLDAIYLILAGYSAEIEVVGRVPTDIARLDTNIQCTKKLNPDVIICDSCESNLRIMKEAFSNSPSIRLIQVNTFKHNAIVTEEVNIPLHSSLDLFLLIVH